MFFLIKKFKKKNIVKKKLFFMGFYYYLQFKGRKVFFNTIECLFMLYTSCKTLHSGGMSIAFSLIQRQIT